MKSTVIVLSLVILVAVVFSAPAGSNNRIKQTQGSGSPIDNTQFEGANQPVNNGQVQAGCNSEPQETGQLNNNEQVQGPRPLHSDTEFGNNRQPQGVRPSGTNGQFHGFRPSDDNSTEKVSHGPHKFNFPTGMPFTGFQRHVGGVTREPGAFGGFQRHAGGVTREPGAFTRAIFANGNQQGGRGKRPT